MAIYKHVISFCPGGTNVMWASLMYLLRPTIWCVHDKLTFHGNSASIGCNNMSVVRVHAPLYYADVLDVV